MTRKRIGWQLARIGWAAGRGSPGDRVRFVALLLAAVMMSLTATAMVATVGVYHHRSRHDQARGPLFAHAGQHATGLWRERPDSVGDTQHTVIFIVPLTSSAPPPGLARWPAPGEEFVSPALERAGEHITTRYGRFGGTIGDAGLASPGERLAYVRPLHPDVRSHDWFKITGFGQSVGLGEAGDVLALNYVLLLLACVVGVPAAVVTVVAARCGSATRDRRGALLQVLGGDRRHRALVDLGEAALPVLLGSALGTLPVWAATLGDVRLPLTGYLLGAAAVRETAWAVPVAALATAVLVLATVVALHRVDRTGRSTRPRSFTGKVPRRRLVAFGAALAVEALSGYLPPGRTSLFAYVAGTIGVWATLPSVAALLSGRFGRRIVASARRTGRPAPLVAGRWITAHPGVIVRLSAAVIVGLGLIVQVQVWYGRLGDPEQAAQATGRRVGDTVLLVASHERLTGARVTGFTRALPPGSRALRLRTPDEGPAVITAACPVLRDLRIGCATTLKPGTGDARAQELRSWLGGDDPLVSATGSARPSDAIVVVSGSPGWSWRVKQAAYATLTRPTVKRLGEDWLTASTRDLRSARWFLAFGIVGVAILLLAALISVSAEFLRFGPALAPLALHTGRWGVFRGIGVWNLTVPLAFATIAGALVTAWQGLQFVAVVDAGHFSWTLLGGATAGGLALSVLIGLAGGRNAARAARRWRPVPD